MDDRIEPFDEFARFMQRYAQDEGIKNIRRLSAYQWAEVHRVALELGVIFHEDGRLELIRQ